MSDTCTFLVGGGGCIKLSLIKLHTFILLSQTDIHIQPHDRQGARRWLPPVHRRRGRGPVEAGGDTPAGQRLQRHPNRQVPRYPEVPRYPGSFGKLQLQLLLLKTLPSFKVCHIGILSEDCCCYVALLNTEYSFMRHGASCYILFH